MIKLITYPKTGRGLRLLIFLDTAYLGAATKVLILMHTEEISQSDNDIADTFLKRNLVFERLRLPSI